MADPVISNPVAFAKVSAANISGSLTVETNKTAWVIIVGSGGLGLNLGNICTLDGIPMNLHYEWWGIANFYNGALIYSLDGVAAGAKTVSFTTHDGNPATMAGIAFNTTNGPSDGAPILPASYVLHSASFARKALAWDNDALAIGIAFSTTGTVTLTEGSAIASNTNIIAKQITAANAEQTWTVGSAAGTGDRTLLTFIIPSLDQVLAEEVYQPLWTVPVDIGGLTPGASYHAGLPYGTQYGANLVGNLIPIPGILRSLAAKIPSSLGSGEQITVELYTGGSSAGITNDGSCIPIPTGVSFTIGGAVQTEAQLDGIDLLCYRYKRLSYVITNTGSTTIAANTFLQITSLFETDALGEQVYGGGQMAFGNFVVDTFVNKAPAHPIPGNWSTSASQKSLIGIDGDITELIVNEASVTTVTPDHEYYIVYDGILQDGSGGTVDTKAVLVANTTGQAIARSQFTLPVVAGKYFYAVDKRKTGGSDLRQAVTIKFKPTISGQFMLSGHSSLAGSYNPFPNSPSGNIFPSEYGGSLIAPPMTVVGAPIQILGMIEDVDPAPGTDKSWTTTLRKNSAATAMPALVIADAATHGETGGLIELTGGDRFSLLQTTVGGPPGDLQFWAIPGQIEVEEPETGSITVIKESSVTEELFPFVAEGLTPEEFSLANGGSQVFSGLPPGTYSIEEVVPPGWTVSYDVSNGDPNIAIELGAGEAVVVTVTNIQAGSSGMYEMIPNKTNDTIWTDVALGTSEIVKIP